MKTKAIAVAASMLLCHASAWAEGLLTGNDAPNLHCVITQCDTAEDCHAPFDLGDWSLNADAGADYLFLISSAWTVTPGHFKLEGFKHLGAHYLVQTTVNIDIDRTTNALRLTASYGGAGVKSRSVVASGNCEAVKTVPVQF